MTLLNWTTIALIGLAPLLLCISPAGAQSDRRALLVGVGDYPPESGWHKLASANDVQMLKGILSDQGFPEDGISILLDRQATRQGILNAIKANLTEKATPGSMAVFHFSGHGQQVQDDNGDEADGLDEALVPYDSPRDYQAGVYEGERLLRDDDLGAALLDLRRKLGKDGILLVLIDACHSGTTTRGQQVVARGTHVVMESPEWALQRAAKPTETHWLPQTTDDEHLAPLVALFSAAPNQLSFERLDDDGRPCGSFSYAFCKTMQRLHPKASYRELLEKIQLEVSAVTARQHPMAEGPIDLQVFGKGLLPAPAHLPVIYEYPFDALLVVHAGQLQGVYPGSQVAIYPPGTTDTTAVAPVAFGTVKKARPFASDILMDRLLPPDTDFRSLRVFLRVRSFGIPPVPMQLALRDKTLEQRLKNNLAEYTFIQISDSAASLYVEDAPGFAGQKLHLYQGGDYLLWSDTIQTTDPAILASQIAHATANYLRAHYLSTLELAHPRIHAEIRVLEKKADGSFDKPANMRPFRLGEKIKLQVKNTGTKGFYFRLYDIQPDRTINTIVPYPNRPAADFRLEPGNTYTFPSTLTVSLPTGADVLKIIATTDPIEIELHQYRGDYSHDPLEVLLRDLSAQIPLRSGTHSLPVTTGFIGSMLFEIVE